MENKFSMKAGFATCMVIVAITFLFNLKLFAPQQMLEQDSSYYTSNSYLTWTASKISDEYMPKGFVRPSNPSSKVNTGDIRNNPLFKMGNSGKFATGQTPLEYFSDVLSVVGALLMIAVIIGKFDIFYGKKTS